MFRYLQTRCDRRDERRARELRDGLGRRRWLLSWAPVDDHRWLARLSCEELTETVEEVAGTRCEAIRLAELALRRSLEHRDRHELRTSTNQ